jgi:hypothetical protein
LCLWWHTMPHYKNNDPHLKQRTLRWPHPSPQRDKEELIMQWTQRTTLGLKEGGDPEVEGKTTKRNKKIEPDVRKGQNPFRRKENSNRKGRGNRCHLKKKQPWTNG